jgi:putative nucleotidyltransferase with HDIG domain
LVFRLYLASGMFRPENFGILNHCLGVAHNAGFLARKLVAAGMILDVELTETGAALHDIGKMFDEGLNHSLAGAEFLLTQGVDGKIIRIVECHEVYSFDETKAPPDPVTWEEKIVFLTDLSFSSYIIPVKERVKDVVGRYPGIRKDWLRLNYQKIYEEILGIIGQPLPF